MSKPVDLLRIGPRLVLVTTIGLAVALAALLGRIGSDAQWLSALGAVIAHRQAIPSGVPFAVAPTVNWANTLVAAELVFHGLQSTLGDRGLMLAQLLAVAAALVVLARDAAHGAAKPIGVSAALLLATLGTLPSLAIVRVQLFSLVLFPVLVAILRAQTRAPSRAIWWVVPLLVLWSNLHGAALLGLAIVFAYLLLERGRRQPRLSAAVGGAAMIALCLTPALARTVTYFYGVTTNLAAERGDGLWGPLSLRSPLDLMLLFAALALGLGMWRARSHTAPSRWETAVAIVLALLTVHAQRNGVWLLFFLVAPAARALAPERSLRALMPVTAIVSVLAIGFAVVRGPASAGASRALVTGALARAGGSPVLADGTIDEQVALAGGRIWAGNPIDAFSRPVQTAYLEWLDGEASGRAAVVPTVRVVLVGRGTATQTLMARMHDFAWVGADRTTALYERIG